MLDTGMSHLAGITLIAQVHRTVGEDAATKATAKRDDYEVAHTMGAAEGMFAKSHHMCIVGHSHSQTETVAQQGCQRDNPLPRHIGCIDDAARQEIGTGSTDSDGTDVLIAAIHLYQAYDTLTQGGHETADIRIILRSEAIPGQDIAPNVYYCESCLFQADVHTYNSFLYRCLIHCSSFSYSCHKNRKISNTNQIFPVFFANIYPKVGFFGNILYLCSHN